MSDRELLDWLQGQQVDVIYLDDGRIIDVGGRYTGNLRKAIEKSAQSAEPTTEKQIQPGGWAHCEV